MRKQYHKLPKRLEKKLDEKINQNALVKFDYGDLPKEYHKKYPFKKDKVYIFLGEIAQMPGHCIVAEYKTGKIICGYHTENFIELTEDEC